MTLKLRNTATSVTELIALASEAETLFGHKDVWFRGHADQSWRLAPSFYRLGRPAAIECRLVQMFRRSAEAVTPSAPAFDDIPKWICLMRHYGLPTRLLDWSLSVLVAGWFAVSESPDSDAAVWAVNPFELNIAQHNTPGIFQFVEKPVMDFLRWPFDGRSDIIQPDVVAAVGPLVDRRMVAQQCSFTVHAGDADLNDMTLKNGKPAASCLGRIDIPSACKPDIRESLLSLGVGPGALFPDLTGVAAQVLIDVDRRKGYQG